ncbi:MAG: two component, sigma54 specific, transcriptional regulator, Fis family [Gemmatimonadetes bacterium]|nr:two component, sigma54 specific, transcriptional regulator, Fis family [Gemmatimonadota bacterium]
MKILVVDDEPGLRQTVSRILGAEGHSVGTAGEGEEALSKLSTEDVDLVLCDLRMPKMDGLEFIERYTPSGGQALVIAMSAYGDSDTAIAAMQKGAYDYVQKPFRAEEVVLAVRKAAEREKLRAKVEELEGQLSTIRGGDAIIGHSASIRAALDMARKVARHPSTVLITGESGTGKELVARLVHTSSPRAEKSFVAVNCGAIPEPLLESELFGHVRGAFTSADRDKMGLFEEANGGTLFLDEIGELPAALQVKLLRALQEGEVRRVGATTSQRIDARVVAATNRDLGVDVASGRFRGDLYYRVNVVTIRLPPLRERSQDVPELALHFLRLYNARLGLKVESISPAAMRTLIDYAWPGNVRELENVIERALVLSAGPTIEREHLSDIIAPVSSAQPATDDFSVKRQTEALERTLIRRALERTNGNRTRAAQLLDLSHRALLYKIRDYELGS